MALELNLTKNTNEQLGGTLGKYYARVEYKGTIGIKELAAHMHQHNTAFSKGIVMGVLGDMVDCIKHLVLDGYTVKIDDLGIFKASVDANGLTLEKGAKISAGRGVQRTDEELQANIASPSHRRPRRWSRASPAATPPRTATAEPRTQGTTDLRRMAVARTRVVAATPEVATWGRTRRWKM